MTSIALVLPLLLGLALFYFPSIVTNRIVAPGTDADTTLTTDVLRATAFSAIGIYFVCSALFDAGYWIAKLHIYYSIIDKQHWFGPPPALMPDDFAGVASTSIQFAIGLLLLFGARSLANFVGKLKG